MMLFFRQPSNYDLSHSWMETMPFSDYIDRVSLLCYIFNGCDALFLNAQFHQIIPFLIAHCPMPILTDSSPLAPGVNRFARDGLIILKGCSLCQSSGKTKPLNLRYRSCIHILIVTFQFSRLWRDYLTLFEDESCFQHSGGLFFFLVACTQLYKKVCPSVRP